MTLNLKCIQAGLERIETFEKIALRIRIPRTSGFAGEIVFNECAIERQLARPSFESGLADQQ